MLNRLSDLLTYLCRAGFRRLAAKAGIVIELSGFEPGFDVFTGLGMLAHVFGKECQRFRVAVRSAFSMKADQASISHAARGILAFANTDKDFPVAFPGG